jgi:hypothetical protein
MDSPTFEALKRIMERVGLRSSDPQSQRDDWLQVAAWMQKVEEALDDVETLGTDDPRRNLREVK